MSIAFCCHSTAAAKLPASEYAAASVVRVCGTFQPVSSHARVAAATACTPLRIFGVRTGRQDPGSTLLPFGVVWFQPGRAVQVRKRSSKFAPLEKHAGAHPQVTRGRGVESNGLVQIFQSFFMFAVREEVDSAAPRWASGLRGSTSIALLNTSSALCESDLSK